MLPFLQVIGHPCDKEVVCPLHTEIRSYQNPEHWLPESNPPGKACMMGDESPVGFYKVLFLYADLCHFSRVIPKPSVTDHYPAQAQCRIDKKRRTPTKCNRQGNDDQRGNCGAAAGSHREHGATPRSLRSRKPATNGSRSVRISSSFAHSEQKADDEQARITVNGASQGGENRPPDDYAKKDFALSPT